MGVQLPFAEQFFIFDFPIIAIYLISIGLLVPVYRREKARALFFLIIISIVGLGNQISDVICFLAPNTCIKPLTQTFTLFNLLLIIMYADSVTRDSIDPKKLALFFFVVGFGVSVDIAQQAYSFVYTQNPLYYAILNIIQVIFMGYVLLLLIYVTLIIYTHCPSGIKKNARWLLASSIVWPSFAIFGTFPIPIQTSMGIYNLWLSGHVAALGVLIIAYVFHKSPGLMHVLPFKTILLSVIDTNAGLAIFSHEWPSKNKIIGEDMFSGMIQGISLVVQEMVGRGTVREMVLDDGVFIFYRNIQHSLAFVLVASKSSKILRDSLQHFGDQFIADYAQYFGNLNEVSQFVGAADLVKKYFPYSN